MEKVSSHLNKMTLWSLYAISLFVFTSFSLAASHHILIILPAVYFMLKSIRHNSIYKSIDIVALTVLVISIWISVFANWQELENPAKVLFKSKYFFIGLLSIFAILELSKIEFKKNHVRNVVNSFLVSTSIASFVGLIAIPLGYNILRFKSPCHPSRACGMYGMTTTYGYGISLALILMVSLFYFRKELNEYFNKKILIVALILNSLGLFFSYARGGLVGFLGGCLIFIWFKSKKLFLIISVASLLTLSFLILNFSGKGGRYLLPLKQPTNILRIYQAVAAYKIFQENPFTGVGFRNFEPNSVKIRSKYKIYNWISGFDTHLAAY